MGLTATIDRKYKDGKFIKVGGTIDWDSSYPTGGEDYTGILSDVIAITMPPFQGYTFEPDYTNRKIKAYTVASATSGGQYTYSLPDAKGATGVTADSSTSDQAAAVVNSEVISALATATAIDAGDDTLTLASQPDCARSVTIMIKNDSGGALNLYEGTTTFAVVGQFRGASQTEDITFVSTAGNKSVANNKFRFKLGTKPFEKIISITVTNFPAGALKISAAPGPYIGLPVDSEAGVDADFLKVAVSATPQTVSSVVSHSNKTIYTGTVADGADVYSEYKTIGGISEVGNGINLSTLTGCPFEAVLR